VSQFLELGISKEIEAILVQNGITVPTEIQEKSIPTLIKSADDFVGIGKTGTGKTLAFGLPLLATIDPKNSATQVLVLVPTRELGQQVSSVIETYSTNQISVVVAYGGVPIKPQMKQIAEGAQVIVATPGRLLDLVDKEAVDLSKINVLVLDEADEMLTALKDDFLEIHKLLPKNKRTWLFTATLSSEVKNIVHNYMSKNYVEVSVNMEISGNEAIEHRYVVVDPIQKLDVLTHFLNEREGQQGIIFCRTKAAVNKLAKNLAISKFSSGALHGSLSQPIRDRIMDQFREGHVSILVATDLAARGIDVQNIQYVVNYHLPETYDTYVHRSGRTARAGAKGFALTVIQQEELKELAEFGLELGINFDELSKPSQESVEENNTYLWAKRIFKTKINHDLSPEFKEKIKSVFQHLSKDELIDKLLSNQMLQSKPEIAPNPTVVKKKKRR
jgi:ATP-dependent RNA helicase DeaD